MSAVLFAPEFIAQRTAVAAAAVPGPRCSVSPVSPVSLVPPVLPVLGQVDAACASLVQAAREAGVQPCCAPALARRWRARRPQAAGTPLVRVQAATQAAPGAVVAALRAGGPLRLMLSGPALGSLAHTLALQVGFDEV